MVTNGSGEALFCRSSMASVVGRVIVEIIFWTVSISVFPLRIVMVLAIDGDLVNSVT